LPGAPAGASLPDASAQSTAEATARAVAPPPSGPDSLRFEVHINLQQHDAGACAYSPMPYTTGGFSGSLDLRTNVLNLHGDFRIQEQPGSQACL